jgi:hypothetical protein
MSENILGKKISDKSLGTGTSRAIVEANADLLAHKAAQIMSLLVEITQGPAEALCILFFLMESIKQDSGIKDIQITERPPQ